MSHRRNMVIFWNLKFVAGFVIVLSAYLWNLEFMCAMILLQGNGEEGQEEELWCVPQGIRLFVRVASLFVSLLLLFSSKFILHCRRRLVDKKLRSHLFWSSFYSFCLSLRSDYFVLVLPKLKCSKLVNKDVRDIHYIYICSRSQGVDVNHYNGTSATHLSWAHLCHAPNHTQILI